MNHFHYINGVLHAENVQPASILHEEVGTPFYCYSSSNAGPGTIPCSADAFSDIDAKVCYAMKANSNQAVLKTLAELGSAGRMLFPVVSCMRALSLQA